MGREGMRGVGVCFGVGWERGWMGWVGFGMERSIVARSMLLKYLTMRFSVYCTFIHD